MPELARGRINTIEPAVQLATDIIDRSQHSIHSFTKHHSHFKMKFFAVLLIAAGVSANIFACEKEQAAIPTCSV